MEERRPSGRAKRQKPVDEGSWDCSVCTFQNPAEAYKCEMCDVRKGTSTRKPRLNAQIAAQQVAQQYMPPAPKRERGLKSEESPYTLLNDSSNDSFDAQTRTINNNTPPVENTSNNFVVKKEKITTASTKKTVRSSPKIDGSSGETMSVTVGSVTVVITDYKPLLERRTSTEVMHNNLTSDQSDCSVFKRVNGHSEQDNNNSNH